MSYELNKSNGELLIELADGLVDDSVASIKFVGDNVTNYGEVQNENFLQLLEHFANITSPAHPLKGQLWYDENTYSLRLKVYDGSYWHQIPTVFSGQTPPPQSEGDFWWDVDQNRLKVKIDSSYVTIGPQDGATTAERLANYININNEPFNGSNSITVSATTTNKLLNGQYLLGDDFNGASTATWSVDVGSISAPEPFKVVARDSAGDIWYSVGHGTATSARFADLAEKYLADQKYEVGTVVIVGGSAEVTACKLGSRAIGVVSGNPGYMMNSELKDGIYIALKGRVPVKVTGNVRKGDRLMAGPNGTAQSASYAIDIFAIALEDSFGKDIIEAIIL